MPARARNLMLTAGETTMDGAAGNAPTSVPTRRDDLFSWFCCRNGSAPGHPIAPGREPLGFQRLVFDDRLHYLQIRISHQGSVQPWPGELAVSSLLTSAETSVALFESCRGRIYLALELILPLLQAAAGDEPSAAPLDLIDSGSAGFISMDWPVGADWPLGADFYLLRAAAARGSMEAAQPSQERFRAEFGAREPVLFWRGSTTGSVSRSAEQLLRNPRVVACRAIVERLGPLADCKISQIVQVEGVTHAEAVAALADAGVLGEVVDESAFARYRFYLDLPGNTAAWGTCHKYLLGCLVFRPEHDREVSYSSRLLPWQHYVPVRADSSDARERVEWAIEHPGEAARIAWNGRALMSAFIGQVDTMYADLLSQLDGAVRDGSAQRAYAPKA